VLVNDDTFDYESHKDWAERVKPPVRREPSRPNGAVIAATIVIAVVLLTLTVSWLLLIAGVLTWR
jgi:hypothetical protein